MFTADVISKQREMGAEETENFQEHGILDGKIKTW